MSEWVVRLVLAGASAGCDTALDVGSGPGKYRAPVRYVASVDGYQQAQSDRHVVGNLLDVLPTFSAGEFDLVYCLDVIEHMTKADGIRLLENMERVAKRAVLVFTPRGFMPQESDIPWQRICRPRDAAIRR